MASGPQGPVGQGSAGRYGPAFFRSRGTISHPTPLLRRGGGAPFAAALDSALDALAAQRYRDASNRLVRALDLERNDRLVWLALSVLRLQTGNFAGAETCARRAHALEPVDPLAEYALWIARAARRDPSTRSSVRRLLDDGVEDARPLSLYIEVVEGRPGAVAGALESLDGNDPNPFLVQLAGVVAVRTGDTDRGERLLRGLADSMETRFDEPGGILATYLPEQPLRGNPIDRVTSPRMGGASGRSTDTALLEPGIVPVGTSMVVYSVENHARLVVNTPPFKVAWDTRRVPTGIHTAIIDFFDNKGRRIDVRRVRVDVSHPDQARPTPDPGDPAWRRDFETRISDGLALVPSRCALHTELAALAARRGDTEGALSALENVCAIDPGYRDAKGSLQRFNRRYVTPGTGYWQGPRDRKRVALTFDDGPNPLSDRTPALLDQLNDLGVPATFFVVGERALMCPELLRRIDEEGHELANHSHTHRDLTGLDVDDVWRELSRTLVVIRDATGKRPRFYRPPGGQLNAKVSRCAASLGMDGGYWTVDGYNHESPSHRPAELADYVVSRTQPGAIILLHNAPDNTLEALSGIVRRLRKAGYQFVTLSELVRDTRSESHPPSPPVQTLPSPERSIRPKRNQP